MQCHIYNVEILAIAFSVYINVRFLDCMSK